MKTADEIALEIFIRRAAEVRPGWNFDAAAHAEEARKAAQVFVESQPQQQQKPKARPRKETA